VLHHQVSIPSSQRKLTLQVSFCSHQKLTHSQIFSTCTSDNEHKTLKATNSRDKKTRADIITMNAALSNVFLANLPKAICEMYKPICMKQPNTVFLHMFDWFISKYGETTTKDCEEN
jgi:hypothetical protein